MRLEARRARRRWGVFGALLVYSFGALLLSAVRSRFRVLTVSRVILSPYMAPSGNNPSGLSLPNVNLAIGRT